MRSVIFLLILNVLLTAPVIQAQELYTFTTEQDRARFEQLTKDLRCIECQGQSVAESYTKLANDIKTFTHQQIINGVSDKAIIDFLTQRYGDEVYAKPPQKGLTLWIWLAPFIFLLLLVLGTYKHFTKGLADA